MGAHWDNIKNATKKIKLPPETESITIEAEKSILQQEKNIQNVEKTLVLKNEISTTTNSEINSLNNELNSKQVLILKTELELDQLKKAAPNINQNININNIELQ